MKKPPEQRNPPVRREAEKAAPGASRCQAQAVAFCSPVAPPTKKCQRGWRGLGAASAMLAGVTVGPLDRHDQRSGHRIFVGLEMERWIPHDLRRTTATILNPEGYSLVPGQIPNRPL